MTGHMRPALVSFLAPLLGLLACSSGTGTAKPGEGMSPGPAGPPVAPGFEPRSGTRLKVVWRVPASGTRIPTGWFHDTQLGLDCWMVAAPGGAARCYPLTSGLASPVVPEFFADDRCTEPLIAAVAPPRPILITLPGCPSALGLFQVEAQAASVARVFAFDGVGCTPAELPTRQVFRTSDASARYQAARVVAGPAANGWSPQFIESDDGSRLFIAWRHAREGYTCGFDTSFARSPDGVLRCFPHTAHDLDREPLLFADAQCRTPAAVGALSTCARIDFARRTEYDCSERRIYYRGGARLPLPFRRGGTTCTAGPESSRSVFAVGPEVPATEFPAVELAVGPGTGRLRPAVMKGMPTPTAVPQIFWDTELGAPCHALGDRCLPHDIHGLRPSRAFADAGCSKALMTVVDTCETAPGQFGWHTEEQPYSRTLQRLSRRHVGPSFRRDGAMCVAGEAVRTEDQLFEVELIPLDTLVTIREERDP